MSIDRTAVLDACTTPSIPATRRSFLRLAAIGGGAVLLRSALPAPVRAASATDALLLTCMDYRLMDDVERYMAGRGLRDRYDHVILAGASLGAVTDKYPAWNQTFREHLDVAISLHSIHKVIIIDHRDCGAYKVILGEEFAKDPAKEREVHARTMRTLRDQIRARHATLEVELLLMSLDGRVEALA